MVNYRDFVLKLLADRSKTEQVLSGREMMMLTAALGLAGEAGEVVDLVKKVVMHGRPFDVEMKAKMLLELGDIRWYQEVFYEILGADDDRIVAANVAKLLDRYPGGVFSSERDIHRAS